MNEVAFLQNYLVLGAILFGIGLAGFLVRRNLIVIFICAELMLQGISMCFVAWGRFHGNWDGQLMVVFIIAVAACEAGIALVLVLMMCKYAGNLDVANWQASREEGIAPYVDTAVPEEVEAQEKWPTLTPAGVRPEIDPEEHMHRTHV
jgi:NADH-quinone oxidoreductase subunit K